MPLNPFSKQMCGATELGPSVDEFVSSQIAHTPHLNDHQLGLIVAELIRPAAPLRPTRQLGHQTRQLCRHMHTMVVLPVSTHIYHHSQHTQVELGLGT
jgi:hypothetical protein